MLHRIAHKLYNGHRLVASGSPEPTPPEPPVDPYNPLGLPANTIRVKFSSGYTPTIYTSQTLVDSTNNVWDIYIQSNNWGQKFSWTTELLEVLGANTTNVTTMANLFRNCTSLTSVPLFDTSNVAYMSNMLNGCINVESGALALYQQASSQANPPSHSQTFTNCGSNTQTGAAELAQIPSDWK